MIASNLWFEQSASNNGAWQRHLIVQQYSMNNLDVADLDGDGDIDVVTNEHKGPDLAVQWWENDGHGKFTKHIIDIGRENHLGTQLFDLDADGDLDIIGAAWDNYKWMHVWRNDLIESTQPAYEQRPRAAVPSLREGFYAGRPHFVITTRSATYYYDKAGGGFSRIIDRQGNDWVSFRPEPWNEYPASAASSYRGLPNLVFGSEDGGAGHPGFDKCRSHQLGDDAIVTESLNGRWKWTWRFHADHARLSIERVDHRHPYWFLYEGTPGGRYQPQHYYFGTDQGKGPESDLPDLHQKSSHHGHYRWAYFGHKTVDRVFYVLQSSPDEKTWMSSGIIKAVTGRATVPKYLSRISTRMISERSLSVILNGQAILYAGISVRIMTYGQEMSSPTASPLVIPCRCMISTSTAIMMCWPV